MRALIAIVRHEIWARRVLLPAALVVGLLAPLLPYFDSERAVVASQVALALLFAGMFAAVFIGFSFTGGELQGWMRFYLARPLATWQIVAGKLLGGFTVVVAVELLLLVPPFAIMHHLLAGSPTGIFGVALDDLYSGWVVGIGLASFLGGAASGVIARSRSVWIFVDSALQMFLVFEMVQLADRLKALRLEDRGETLWAVILVLMIVAGLAALTASVSRGCADPRRAHRALSQVLWGVAIPGVTFVLLYARFVLA